MKVEELLEIEELLEGRSCGDRRRRVDIGGVKRSCGDRRKATRLGNLYARATGLGNLYPRVTGLGIPPVPKKLLQDRWTEECHCAIGSFCGINTYLKCQLRGPCRHHRPFLRKRTNRGLQRDEVGTAAVNEPPLLTISHDMGRLGNRMFLSTPLSVWEHDRAAHAS
ncbi:hypothetical protein Btru_060434 [Bulinus truncatus]|nr:hypothetical protein Btru_060434 [Bulinus truncatus]